MQAIVVSEMAVYKVLAQYVAASNEQLSIDIYAHTYPSCIMIISEVHCPTIKINHNQDQKHPPHRLLEQKKNKKHVPSPIH